MTVRITVTVNGSPREVAARCTLAELVDTLGSAPSGLAAAVNDTVVPRKRWPDTELTEGDRVEILTAVQGG